MQFKGILRGDHTFRHFTFDDKDVIWKGSESYYKVNYGKNPLEGEAGEDEIGYVPCDKVMVIGGRKPAPPTMKRDNASTSAVEKPVEETPKPKRGRPRKIVEEIESMSASQATYPVAAETCSYEYLVEEFVADDVGSLQSKLNKFGKDGWEMCGFDSLKSLFKNTGLVAVFKRKRS